MNRSVFCANDNMSNKIHFPASLAATGGHVTQLWPIRCKQSVGYFEESCIFLLSVLHPSLLFRFFIFLPRDGQPFYDQRQILFPLWKWSPLATVWGRLDFSSSQENGHQLAEAVWWVSEQFCGFFPFHQVFTELERNRSCCSCLLFLFTWQGDTAHWGGTALWKLHDPFCVGHVYGSQWPHYSHLRQHVTVWLSWKKNLTIPKSLFS